MKKNDDLYISIGNTRVSFAFFVDSIDNHKIIKRKTKDFFEQMNFQEIFDELDITPMKIFVCSVVKYANQKLLSFFKNKEIIFLNYKNQNIVNLNLLDNPSEIGNDIIASAIYAKYLGKNITVVSLGTATVISNIIDGSIVGCIILPGLEISYDALIKNTMINKYHLESLDSLDINIGKNTKDSISIGVISGHRMMIQELCKSFNTPNSVYIYFGGNASYIHFNGWTKKDDLDLLGLYLFSLKR